VSRRPREIWRYDAKQIGILLRHMRRVAGLSQGQLAPKMGFSDRASVARIENGAALSIEKLMLAGAATGFDVRIVATQRSRGKIRI
jgi:transcriptional regulator with XRE-family HTH domain